MQRIDINKSSYNNIAHKWSLERSKSFVSKLVIDFADKVLPKGRILDVGCGSGTPLAKYLSERGFSIMGIDLSDQMIELARSSSIPNTEFTNCDFFDFVTTSKFDGVLAWDSFWHFPQQKQESIYQKVKDLTKKDGYLLFTHGNVGGEHTDAMMGESFYYSSLPTARVHELLMENDFKIEYSFEDFVEEDSHRALVVLAKRK